MIRPNKLTHREDSTPVEIYRWITLIACMLLQLISEQITRKVNVIITAVSTSLVIHFSNRTFMFLL